MMWCTLMTKENILPHIIQNKISEKRYSSISLKDYEKILLLTDWASSRSLPTSLFLSYSFQSSSSCQVYNTVFHSWAQKVFLLVLSPLFPLNTLKSQSFFSPSSAKAMVFPVVMYGCESWTIKKTAHQRIDAFELWCWRRLLRVPWTAKRSSQSILKEISPEC